MPISDDQLFSALKENQYVEDAQLQNAKQVAQEEKISLYEALIEKDIVSDENLGKIVADLLHLPFVALSKIAIDENIVKIVPEDVARKQHAVIFSHDNGFVSIATTEPDNKDFFQFISKKTGFPVHVFYATEKDITNTLQVYKRHMQETFNELLKKEVSEAKSVDIKDVPIAKLVDLLIEYGYYNKASDVHIEPRQKSSIVRFRIDGILHDVLDLPKELHHQVITRIKVLSRLRTDEHLSAQDGKLRIEIDDDFLDVRVSIVPIVAGEDAVLRLLSSKSRQFSLSDLGMADKDLQKIKASYVKPYGMILVTGPTGSGKTTTIYAVLKILNTREKNIATIEDPVEYELLGINQIQVNTKTNLTFVSGLRSILRQDPDIIFVGEIRDTETADIAINAALTGHLVLSTLHTNDAATAIPRLIDMKIEPFLVSSTVNVIIAQRLVRKICDTCKVSFAQPREEFVKFFSEASVKKHFGAAKQITTYKGKGCQVCHKTGFQGRVGIFEVLEVSEKIQTMITNKATAEEVKQQALREGMTTMFDDGLSKVQAGVTTIEELLRATKQEVTDKDEESIEKIPEDAEEKNLPEQDKKEKKKA
jgi:type IV pilus assembly protein PilB